MASAVAGIDTPRTPGEGIAGPEFEACAMVGCTARIPGWMPRSRSIEIATWDLIGARGDVVVDIDWVVAELVESLGRDSHCSSACKTAARSSAAGTGYFSTAIAPSLKASLARSGW